MAFAIITSINAAAEPQTSSDDSGKDAIDMCRRAWKSAHDNQAEIKGSSNWDCEKAGNKAYLRAVPALSGYRNICDFVACINYASMTGVIIHTDAAHYLDNARIALSTIYHNPKLFREHKRQKPRETEKEIRKIFRYFAKFSPFKSFRINKSLRERPRRCAQLRPFCASQLLWNQHATCANANGPFSLLFRQSTTQLTTHDARPTATGALRWCAASTTATSAVSSETTASERNAVRQPHATAMRAMVSPESHPAM